MKHLIVNRRAPVRLYARKKVGIGVEEETRDLRNYEEFERLYRPKHHGEMWAHSQFLFTDVLLDRIDDPPHALTRRTDFLYEGRSPTDPGKLLATPHRHRVECNGVIYRSVWAAWQALSIPNPKDHVKFRSELKRTGSGVYQDYKFNIVEE